MHALVIAGGSVRAAYANGVLAAWEEAGWDPFDAVYGTSAGGALAAWWSAGQARYAEDTWRYVEDRRILSWSRLLLNRGPLMDHDALFEVVYEDEMPLDTEAVREAPHPVVVPVTDAETGETRYRDVREGPVVDWLRAAGRMPLACGPPVEVDGRRWIDGGLTDALLVEKAIEDGAHRVTLVLNRPPEPRSPESRVSVWFVDRKFPGLGEAVAEHHRDWWESVQLARDPPEGVEAEIVAPDGPLEVGRLTRDLEAIEETIARGRQDGRAHLDRAGLEAEAGADAAAGAA